MVGDFFLGFAGHAHTRNDLEPIRIRRCNCEERTALRKPED